MVSERFMSSGCQRPSQLKARTRKHPGLELCCDRRQSIRVSSGALFMYRLEACRVALHLARGYIFHVLHWFLFLCHCGRPRAGARARAVRPGARRPPTPGSLSFNTAGDAWQVSSALARVHLSEKYTHWQCNCMRRCRQPSVRGSRRAAQALQEMYP